MAREPHVVELMPVPAAAVAESTIAQEGRDGNEATAATSLLLDDKNRLVRGASAYLQMKLMLWKHMDTHSHPLMKTIYNRSRTLLYMRN